MIRRRVVFFLVLALTIIILAMMSLRTKEGQRKRILKSKEAAEQVMKIRVSPDKDSAMVAVVLDDFGYTKKNLDSLKNIGIPITVAVLPNTPYSGEVCSFAKKNGFEVILHLPMEPENEEERLEKDTISGDMDEATVRKVIADAFDSVSSAKGVSNHMGSKATKDKKLMKVVFGDLKERGVFFLDSVTTDSSVCKELTRKAAIPYAKRDIFIDNELNERYVEKQLQKLEKIALSEGCAVAVGHDRAVTVDVLRKVIPAMKKKGIRFVHLSEVIGVQS